MKFKYWIVFILVLIAHLIAGYYYNGYSLWWIVAAIGLFLSITAMGATFIRWNFFMNSINSVPLSFDQLRNNTKPIALTFDDGPQELTEQVLDILKAENIRATFFLIGKNIAEKAELVKRMHAEGHLIGNHSFNHGTNFDWQSAANMKADLQQCSDAIKNVTGSEPFVFRPPFGITNPNLAKAIKDLGLQSIGWNLRSYDTVAKDPQQLLKKIMDKVQINTILLLHDRCQITVDILPDLIKQLKDRGYNFVFPINEKAHQ